MQGFVYLYMDMSLCLKTFYIGVVSDTAPFRDVRKMGKGRDGRGAIRLKSASDRYIRIALGGGGGGNVAWKAWGDSQIKLGNHFVCPCMNASQIVETSRCEKRTICVDICSHTFSMN